MRRRTSFKMIKSVEFQTYRNWECIIICNNCSDNTFDYTQRITQNDKRFKVF